MNEVLVGPVAALALALVVLGLFYTGKIMPRNTVPREDYKALQDVNASYAAGIELQTRALNELVTVVRHLQRNGGV